MWHRIPGRVEPSPDLASDKSTRMLKRLRNRFLVFAHDILIVPLAWFGAYWLRFNLESVPSELLRSGANVFPIVLLVQGASFWYFGLYRGSWRFASLPDLVRIIRAVAVGAVAGVLLLFLLNRMQGIPRSVPLIYALLLIGLVSTPRLVYRWLKDHRLSGIRGRKALVVGAGKAGEMLVRELLRDPGREYEPVGFVDDDDRKRGQEIHGIRIIGNTSAIGELANGIDAILIAVPSASAEQMRCIVSRCEETGVVVRTIPRLEDLVAGRASIKALRDVRIDDLLGRAAVTLEWEAIRKSSEGRCVMVTGGGGSIGSELCRQIARLGPSKLIVLEQNEFNLYTIDLELRSAFPKLALVTALGDAGDPRLVDEVLRAHRPDIVFHAAAYKHVPMLEDQVRAAVRNNVTATRTLAQLVSKHGCGSFVLISTDKAVNPSNVMGTTKLVAESYCQSLNGRSRTQFITVRFGNVLGSAGSVIPLFQKQIAEGGPVTVTDPNVTRYFMTIPEAAQLILQASSVGRGGEIFVLDMGEPVNIKYLAEQLILLSGKKPGEDMEIVYTGLRPGEKPYEELFHESEALIETSHPKTLLARSRAVSLEFADSAIDALAKACETNDESELRRLLSDFVRATAGSEEQSESAGTRKVMR